MLYVDTPTFEEFCDLDRVRSEACVSIYLPTTPVTPEVAKSRIQFGNLCRSAIGQLEAVGLDKRRLQLLKQKLDKIALDDEFWVKQAHSLAVLATPDLLHTYRLANRLQSAVEVSDRFHLKPLLRAITFPHAAYVLAISENSARLIEVSPDLPAAEVEVPGMPSNASLLGPLTQTERAARGLEPSAARKRRITQYVRKISAALRPVLMGNELPVVLAATLPLESIFRTISETSVLPQTITGSSDRLSAAKLAKAARPVLDAHYRNQISEFHALFEKRKGQNRATGDLFKAARFATSGSIDTLLVNFDAVINGFVDEDTGEIAIDTEGDAVNYGVIDEIAGRALRTGARVLAVRGSDLPKDSVIAAILRYPAT